MTDFKYFDLTTRPPRSPRTRLGGFVILPRLLDKCRALIAGKNGEYNFDCSLDRYFLSFMDINAEQLKQQVEQGLGDNELLTWILENSPKKVAPHEIVAWSNYHENRAPQDLGSRAYFTDLQQKVGAERKDIGTWFDLLDLDDYVSFGGKV